MHPLKSQKTEFILMQPMIRDSSSLMKEIEMSDTQQDNKQDQIILETSLEEANISMFPPIVDQLVDKFPQNLPEQTLEAADNEKDPQSDFKLQINSGETMMDKQNRSEV